MLCRSAAKLWQLGLRHNFSSFSKLKGSKNYDQYKFNFISSKNVIGLKERFQDNILRLKVYIEEKMRLPEKLKGGRVEKWALGILVYAIQTNPDEQSFRNSLILCRNELSLVSDSIRNPKSDSHMQYLLNCYNQGLLHRASCGPFSVIWVDNYHPDCSLYDARCSYLKPRYLTFYERIVDVGIFGKWWNLRKMMIDYDVNPEEWNKQY
ncbi:mitochondrial import inner membrane translocase subunit Tim29-like isoform X2 [Limulus polyphemus]|uniref:Mitochondrial import inner membrane translocase subunit Tim29-like isoform X2 n=1 Tax=Limulus polyphemus TaxID=6850 RepID=A0ABM1S7L5_LIMPO|nr:mitochondrial import inner membrane translocase subunit Tim29-like isoform X2 [Limulus polyphemus]